MYDILDSKFFRIWGAIYAACTLALWTAVFARTLSVAGSLPYDAWLAQVQAAPLDAAANPCVKIVPFLEDEFVRMATGQVVLDTAVAQRLSPALRESGPLEEEHLVCTPCPRALSWIPRHPNQFLILHAQTPCHYSQTCCLTMYGKGERRL